MKKNNSIGEILRKRREEKGLLLRQVAALLDVDTAILSKIERGERKAKKEQIVQLAKILELNQEDLIIQFLSERILYEIHLITILIDCLFKNQINEGRANE